VHLVGFTVRRGYFRSVNHILIAHDYATTDINSILDAFEHVHPNLNFTFELANNNKMNYLHLTIYRQLSLVYSVNVHTLMK
jgi:hypothetical protein